MAYMLSKCSEGTNVCEAIRSFTDQFAVENKLKLHCISSGAAASPQIVLTAEAAGKESFITDWIEKHTKFFEPIKRLNLKTLDHMSKTIKVTTAQNRVVLYKQEGNVALQLLAKSQSLNGRLDLIDLLNYSLIPIPQPLVSC